MQRFHTTICILTAIVACTTPAQAQPRLKQYETPYYIIHTDLDPDSVREVALRMPLMAEEYYARTKDFSGKIRKKLPFYLFRHAQDYYRMGGMPGSVGDFTGNKLMAIAGDRISPATWHTIQHEGFHQFARAVIGGDIPPWVNEGLAEYFGRAVFTGDNFIAGVIPSRELAWMKQGLEQDKFPSILQMMTTNQELWNTHVSLRTGEARVHYLQSWSMVQFLAHGDNGKYCDAFGRFIRDVSRGRKWEQAWTRHFGSSVQAFEERWRTYWLELPDNPTAELYAKATTRTLTRYLARAFSQRQYFDSYEEFVTTAEAGLLKAHKDDWLPPVLLEDALRRAQESGTWSIKKIPGRTTLVCELDDGTKLTGSFKVRHRHVRSVDVKIKRPRKRP